MRKLFSVKLTDSEVDHIKKLIRQKSTTETMARRCRILLNIAEIELNVMTRQCLSRRIPNIDMLRKELAVWESERNNSYAKVNWQFKTTDARIELKSLYPKIDKMTNDNKV